jgi:hypothetical protein
LQRHKTIANYFCKIVGKIIFEAANSWFRMHTPNYYAPKRQTTEKQSIKIAFEILLRGAPLVAQRLRDLACAALPRSRRPLLFRSGKPVVRLYT